MSTIIAHVRWLYTWYRIIYIVKCPLLSFKYYILHFTEYPTAYTNLHTCRKNPAFSPYVLIMSASRTKLKAWHKYLSAFSKALHLNIVFTQTHRPEESMPILNTRLVWIRPYKMKDQFKTFLNCACDHCTNIVICGDFNFSNIQWEAMENANGANELLFVETLNDHFLSNSTTLQHVVTIY